MDRDSILKEIDSLCKQHKLQTTKFAEKIADRKALQDDWKKCPCDSDPASQRYCLSEQCKSEVMTNGHCHCNLFELTYCQGWSADAAE